MEIERNEEKKIISVWLTKAESQDEDLQHSTINLLAYNEKCCAKLAAERETQVQTRLQIPPKTNVEGF